MVEQGHSRKSQIWLSEEPALLVAEIRHFIRAEMARTLTDVVFRRSNLGSAECPAGQVLERIASVMAEELAWIPEEQQRQIDRVRQAYAPLVRGAA
jgi:glycerol-3-phosphate dehydrogenase